MPTKPRARTPLRDQGSYQADSVAIQRRFARVQGQIDGVRQMVDDERYCPEVLVQLSAAIAGLEKIGYMLLRDHIAHCVVDGVKRGEGEKYLDELLATMQRFSGR